MEDKSNIIKKAISGFKFTLLAQIIVLMLSIIKSVILPKILSIQDYGYWQIYVLYSTYVGVFALGFNDGIYLIYGKYQYEELPFPKLRMATRFYIGMLLLITLAGSILCCAISDQSRRFAMLGVCTDITLMGINGLLIYVLQITNQIRAYSFYSILDKIVLLMAVISISFISGRDYRMIVAADVISRAVVALGLIIKCKDFVIGKSGTIVEGWKEFTLDVKTGISLMIANLMGMFVTGIGRFIVDTFGDISQYAYYSFGITITNLVLVFITAVSLVLYPTLKRLPKADYGRYLEKINFSVTLFNFVALFAYFPAVVFIRFFLPQYVSILEYLHLLFGVVILQAKIQLINNTFYKVLREEKALLKANMNCVILFLLLAFLLYRSTQKVSIIALCTFISMFCRCYISECFIRKKLDMAVSYGMWIEIAYIILFELILSIAKIEIALVGCFVLFGIYIVMYHSEIKLLIQNIVKRK